MLLIDVPLVIVIVNYKTAPLVIDCLASIHRCASDRQRVYVELVDNASPDSSFDILSSFLRESGFKRWVHFTNGSNNGGFSYGNNFGIALASESQPTAKYILLLNPDTVVQSDSCIALTNFLEANPNVAIVGSRLEDPDGSTQYAARRFPCILNELDYTARCGPISRLLKRSCIVMPESDSPHECDWLPGASLMIRREVFEKIGLLDEGFFMYFEEVDFCKRAKDAGFKIGYVPSSRVIHLVGQASGVTSSGQPIKKRRPTYWFDSRSRYFLRHHGRSGLLAANMAWLLGQCIYHTVRTLRGRPNEDPPFLVWDFIRHMLRLRTWKSPGPPIYPDLAPQPSTPASSLS
ncbi:glycosyltransferase family 2 protein [Pirellulaceae bacterium SH467]